MSSQNAAQVMAINRETFVKLQFLLISERGDLTSQRIIRTAEKQMIFITSFNRRLNELVEGGSIREICVPHTHTQGDTHTQRRNKRIVGLRC